MEKFITLTDTAVPLEIENIDTDQIIPARFLKATDKAGFGENLFRDWRFDNEGNIWFSEIYGKKRANSIVTVGIFASIFSILIIYE